VTIVTARERASLEEDGYFVREGALPRDECARLREHLARTIARLAREDDARALRGEPRIAGDYPRSAHTAALFFDKAAPDPLGLPPEERERCVVRVGHALHLADEIFRAYASDARVTGPVVEILGETAVVDCLAFCKPPRHASPLGDHQDASYLRCEPDTLRTVWIALDDAGEGNGGLRVVPGSHRAKLAERPAMQGANFDAPVRRADLERAPVVLSVEAGALVVYDGHLQHGSGPNPSADPRRAFVCHLKAARSRWLPENWFAEPRGGFFTIPAG
jgi:phytanoyl-CoA hydroxylase